MSNPQNAYPTPEYWTWSIEDGRYYHSEQLPDGNWTFNWFGEPSPSVPRNFYTPQLESARGPQGGIPTTGGGSGGVGSGQPLEPYGASPRNYLHGSVSSAPVDVTTNDFARMQLGPQETSQPSSRPQQPRRESQNKVSVGSGRVEGSASRDRRQSSSKFGRSGTFSASDTTSPESSALQGYSGQLYITTPQQTQYNSQIAIPGPALSSNSGLWPGYPAQPVPSSSQRAGKLREPPVSSLHTNNPQSEVTDEAGSLIAGTYETSQETLDPSYCFVKNEWEFFVRGRVFQLLLIENASETVPKQGKHMSIVSYGEYAYARISRFIIVEAKPERHYSKCIPISTYGQRATESKSAPEQREHGIVYTGSQAPRKLPREKALHKDPIQVQLDDPSMKLAPESRVNFAFTRPIQHNVKVKNVGKVAKADMYKLIHYWKEYR